MRPVWLCQSGHRAFAILARRLANLSHSRPRLVRRLRRHTVPPHCNANTVEAQLAPSHHATRTMRPVTKRPTDGSVIGPRLMVICTWPMVRMCTLPTLEAHHDPSRPLDHQRSTRNGSAFLRHFWGIAKMGRSKSAKCNWRHFSMFLAVFLLVVRPVTEGRLL